MSTADCCKHSFLCSLIKVIAYDLKQKVCYVYDKRFPGLQSRNRKRHYGRVPRFGENWLRLLIKKGQLMMAIATISLGDVAYSERKRWNVRTIMEIHILKKKLDKTRNYTPSKTWICCWQTLCTIPSCSIRFIDQPIFLYSAWYFKVSKNEDE